ncbi:phosphotransferase [Actinomadura rupiterrae]|uniref:phosphotransferase n=1 Tax=Actinomadura rupiterrae TaxID=559627 RepID=UPI003555E01D
MAARGTAPGHDGRISAVIDFGDLTCGDPATDLSVAWMLSTAQQRTALRQAYGRAEDATWERGRGWRPPCPWSS